MKITLKSDLTAYKTKKIWKEKQAWRPVKWTLLNDEKLTLNVYVAYNNKFVKLIVTWTSIRFHYIITLPLHYYASITLLFFHALVFCFNNIKVVKSCLAIFSICDFILNNTYNISFNEKNAGLIVYSLFPFTYTMHVIQTWKFTQITLSNKYG